MVNLQESVVLVGTRYSLNEKQFLTVAVLLKRVMDTPSGEGVGLRSIYIFWRSRRHGKNGTDKDFLFGLAILDRVDDVLLTAPTGSAASHIGGSTIHAALGVSSFEHPRRGQLEKVRKRLARIKFLVVDEVSMVGCKMLTRVDEKCSRIWPLSSGSSAVLGGLPIILFLGDFKQFEPVPDTPLWKDNGIKATKDEKRAREIWNQVKDVIFLTDQMRQRDDLPYQELLQRAETCFLTQADIGLLNTVETREKWQVRKRIFSYC